MITAEYIELVDKLLSKTQCDEVNWSTISSDSDFVVYFHDFSMSISGGYNANEEYVRVVLRNDNGVEIDSFWAAESENEWKALNDLLLAARRKAFNIDKAIHSILSELDTDGIIGQEKPPQFDDIPF